MKYRTDPHRHLIWLVLTVIALIGIVAASSLSGHVRRVSAFATLSENAEDPPPRLPLRHVPDASAEFVPGRLLVKFHTDLPLAQRKTQLAAKGLTSSARLSRLDLDVVEVPVGEELALAKQLERDPSILYAEPDYLVHALTAPNDPYYAHYQWNMPHIGLEEAWDTTTGSTDIIIAIIDSGVDLDHPDLSDKLVAGYDFVNNDSHPDDDNGHGTHVAGIAAAATNNYIGVAGVSWDSKIMPIRVLDSDGTGSISQVASGISWAVDNGADIVNLSLGSTSFNSTLKTAVDYAHTAGCLLVAAAGNAYEKGNPTIYPAALDRVMAVGAVDHEDERASYSNTGNYLDVVAPGGTDGLPIFSTYQGDYAWSTGTSMACPHVAGLAALIWSVDVTLTNDDVQSIIETTAVDLGSSGWNETFGWGRIDAAAAVAAVAVAPTPTSTHTPTPTATSTVVQTATSTSTPTFTPASLPTETSTPIVTPHHLVLPLIMNADVSATPTPSPTNTPTATSSPTPSPTRTPTPTSTASPTPTECNTKAQIVANPSFETGWQPWQIKDGYPERTLNSASDGVYSVLFGGYNNSTDWLTQKVIVPEWAEDGALYFSWAMLSEDSPYQPYDYLTFWLWDKDMGEGLLYSEVNNTAERGTWYRRRVPIGSIDVVAARGHTLEISIMGYTDDILPTLWYVDDVQLVFSCGDQTP